MSMTIYPHCQNPRRAACAKAALAAYKRAKNDRESCEAEPTVETLIDLLTDLRHWAASAGLGFQDAVRTSQDHFLKETDDDD